MTRILKRFIRSAFMVALGAWLFAHYLTWRMHRRG